MSKYSYLSEVPSLLKIYSYITAIAVHILVFGYLAYAHLTCTGWGCVGTTIETNITKWAVLILLILSSLVACLLSNFFGYSQGYENAKRIHNPEYKYIPTQEEIADNLDAIERRELERKIESRRGDDDE